MTAITFKPRIRLSGEHWRGLPIWECSFAGRRGIGTDPDDAYWAWVAAGEKVW